MTAHRNNEMLTTILTPPIFEGVDRVRSGFTRTGSLTPEQPLGNNMSVADGVVREGLLLVSQDELEGESLDVATAREIMAAHQRREALVRHIGEGVIRYEHVASPKPVHGASLVEVDRTTIHDLRIDSPTRQEADATAIMEVGYGSLMTPADCAIVEIIDPNIGGVVAQFHAGYQGITAGVVSRGMEGLKERGLDPKYALVHIAPTATRFELARKGLALWEEAGLGEFVTKDEGTTFISMTDAIIAQLIEAGVQEGRIQTSRAYTIDGNDINTLTDPAFYSHRNRKTDGITGRNGAFLARVGE